MSTPTAIPIRADALAAGLDAYRAKTRGSEVAFSRASEALPGGVSRQTLAVEPYPPFVVSARGCELIDVDGNRYVDFVNNYTSLIHGHAHPGTVEAVGTCLGELGSAPGLPSLLEHELAGEVRRRFDPAGQVRFTVSGSEAAGYAIRLARAATGRQRVLKFEGGFHGSFNDVQCNIGADALPSGAAVVGAPNSGVGETSTIVSVYNDLESVDDAFEHWPGEIACVIVEPFLGNAALIEAAPGFLAAVHKRAAAAGALFILDEIQSCRLAYGGVRGAHGVEPDITLLGKTIGGGLPLAAVLASPELMLLFGGVDAPEDGPMVSQTGTFNAFPPALASGLATLAEYGPSEIDALNAEGDRLRSLLRDVFASRDVPVWIGGRGSMFHISLTERPIERYADLAYCDAATWRIVHLNLLLRGIYLMPRGTGCLSTASGPEATDALIAAIDDSLAAILSN